MKGAGKLHSTGQSVPSHRLAAIMFTDIQGYTALMQEDEEQAVQIREEHRRVFNSTTKKYQGKILQYYGDGTLSIFDSTVDAVKCAIEMQLDFPIPVRIGIHTGDIIHSDEEIIGDGVNIASRIESLAVVGGVFVSGKVYDDIKNQKSISTKLVGSFMLENVMDPVDVYAISNDGLVVPFSNQIKGSAKATIIKDPTPDRPPKPKPVSGRFPGKYIIPGILIIALLSVVLYFLKKGDFRNTGNIITIEKSIAIIPFENLSDDPEQDYFSDGITEDMITHLAKIGDLNVISRTSVMGFKNTTQTTSEIARQLNVNHLLTGSIRKSDNQVRISVQLIDAKTDKYLWADTYDREVDDIFAIQSEVSIEVAKALKAELTQEEEDNVNVKPTSNTEAYELYLKGLYNLRRGSIEGLNESLPLLLQAISIDPDFAEAYAEIGMYYIRQGVWTGNLDAENARNKALPYINKALELDPDLNIARVRLGIIKFLFEWDFAGAEREFIEGKSTSDYGFSLLLMGRFQEAEELFEASHRLNPMGRLDRPYRGIGQYFLDQPEMAIETLQDGIRFQPDVPDGYHKLGKIYLNLENYGDAINTLEHGLSISSARIPSLLGDLAIAYYKSGQEEESLQIIEELRSIEAKGLQGSPSFFLGQAYAGTGKPELAFEWLEKSYEAHEVELIWLKIEPQFDLIRSDPRFADLLDKVGFRN